MNSRLFAAILLTVSLSGCATPQQEVSAPDQLNQSLADSVLTKDALRFLKMFEDAMRLNGEAISPFGMPRVVEKKLIQGPDARGVWVEEWTIQRIGSRVAYTIKFTPSRDGGTDFSVRTPPRKI